MARIEITVKMNNIYSYTRAAYGYGTETAYIYNMKDAEGNVYVWKTTTMMVAEIESSKGWITKKNGKTYDTIRINRGDEIRIKATVKGNTEYKGQPQTEVNRVAVVEIVNRCKSKEELDEEKRKEQLASLQNGDFVWNMPYKQYKNHYSDCETIAGSYMKVNYEPATISVIIREGRLKNSGTRGRHFNGYAFEYMEDGKKYHVCYRAINEENAFKRLTKENPEATDIECVKIYMY